MNQTADSMPKSKYKNVASVLCLPTNFDPTKIDQDSRMKVKLNESQRSVAVSDVVSDQQLRVGSSGASQVEQNPVVRDQTVSDEKMA